jgi:hypothetical protein
MIQDSILVCSPDPRILRTAVFTLCAVLFSWVLQLCWLGQAKAVGLTVWVGIELSCLGDQGGGLNVSCVQPPLSKTCGMKQMGGST